MALVYEKMGFIDKCIVCVENCLEKDKNLHYCYTFLGKLYYNYYNDFEKALNILQ